MADKVGQERLTKRKPPRKTIRLPPELIDIWEEDPKIADKVRHFLRNGISKSDKSVHSDDIIENYLFLHDLFERGAVKVYKDKISKEEAKRLELL